MLHHCLPLVWHHCLVGHCYHHIIIGRLVNYWWWIHTKVVGVGNAAAAQWRIATHATHITTIANTIAIIAIGLRRCHCHGHARQHVVSANGEAVVGHEMVMVMITTVVAEHCLHVIVATSLPRLIIIVACSSAISSSLHYRFHLSIGFIANCSHHSTRHRKAALVLREGNTRRGSTGGTARWW